MEKDGIHRVADIKANTLFWNLVVGVARVYQMPCTWGSKDEFTMEMVLQDKEGDRIQCSVPSDMVSKYEAVIKENKIYSMKNFIVKEAGKGLRVTSHPFKLRFFGRTSVGLLPSEEFRFSPFRCLPYGEINNMCSKKDIFLIDCVGQVVGKEDPEDIITKAGQSSKRMRLYLEDEEKNKMKCTLFGDFVGEAVKTLQTTDAEPLVMVAQLFKPHVYLSDFCIQPSFYGSRIFFNPDFPEVMELRNRLIANGDRSSQQVTHFESQSARSVTEEISSGTFPLRSIEEVLHMTEENSCWILASIVSLEGGGNGWYYAFCFSCNKKVVPVNDNYTCRNCGFIGTKPSIRYMMKVIVNDCTGCINLLIWNTEAFVIVGKSASDVRDVSKQEKGSYYPKILEEIVGKTYLFRISVSRQNISSGDQLYSVSKISDDKALIDLYSSQASFLEQGAVDQCESNVAVSSGTADSDSPVTAADAIVSLSKDSESQTNNDTCEETPPPTVEHVVRVTTTVGGVNIPEGQGSNGKTFKRGGGKRKTD